MFRICRQFIPEQNQLFRIFSHSVWEGRHDWSGGGSLVIAAEQRLELHFHKLLHSHTRGKYTSIHTLACKWKNENSFP